MIKRPVCLGAFILSVLLLVCSLCGVSETVPLFSSQLGKRVQVMGRVEACEHSSGGMRLYLSNFSFITNSVADTAAAGTPSINAISEDDLSEEAESASSFTENKTETDTVQKQSWKILVWLDEDPGKDPEIGSWIVAEGICRLPDASTNPGQFDTAQYYLTRHVAVFLRNGKVLQKSSSFSGYRTFLNRIRNGLHNAYYSVFADSDAALAAAITLGDRNSLTAEQKQRYQEGGIAHIIAISSLHVTLLGRGCYRLMRKHRFSFLTAGLLSFGILFSYCLMTGMSVSAVRACVMFLIWIGSQITGRTSDSLTALAVAAAVILLRSPGYLTDCSFLLSFGCILSLQLLTPVLEILLPLPGKTGNAFRASAAVQLGTLPVVMYFFYQVTPYGVLANLIVLPCMELLMLSGLAGGLLGLVSVPLGTLAASPCHYLLEVFDLICGLERRMPGAVWITGRPAIWQIIFYYLLLGAVCFRIMSGKKTSASGKKTAGKAGTWVLLILAVWLLGLRIRPGLRLTFLDVGQGDGILVESRDFTCLIDGGSSSVDQVWQYRIEKTLKYYGISRLDAVFVSHGDQDHISGVQQLLESYERNAWGENVGSIRLDRLVLPALDYKDEKLEKLRELALQQKITVSEMGWGDSVDAGELSLLCLNPQTDNTVGEGNQDSMVLLLQFGGFSALFTGDLEKEGEERFLEIYEGGPVTLLKVGHHGSKNASSEAFLERLSPGIGVISCGEDNRYGHPAQETLLRLERAGVQIRRTDLEGAVIVRS